MTGTLRPRIQISKIFVRLVDQIQISLVQRLSAALIFPALGRAASAAVKLGLALLGFAWLGFESSASHT